jgi:transposase-like protein
MGKKITPELQARAVRLVAEHQEDYPSRTAATDAVAKQLGLGRETLRRWLVQAEVDSGGRAGLTSTDGAEIKRLKAENRRLREDVEILKAATSFFAGELDSRNR